MDEIDYLDWFGQNLWQNKDKYPNDPKVDNADMLGLTKDVKNMKNLLNKQNF